ncbi:hypothetical protein FNV43_RR22133 [Rhamnella rubrinervis]|uniref:FAD synthase n=1 Tax=Rhamnella rubrinervis TaxID=2594499 RepID=A0A8K0DUK6_9ROSA|nr:hypothetical protein FNV43_RR22133 [Rhamnella rubrinervis]
MVSGGANVDANAHPPTPKSEIDPWKMINNTKMELKKVEGKKVMLKAWGRWFADSFWEIFPQLSHQLWCTLNASDKGWLVALIAQPGKFLEGFLLNVSTMHPPTSNNFVFFCKPSFILSTLVFAVASSHHRRPLYLTFSSMVSPPALLSRSHGFPRISVATPNEKYRRLASQCSQAQKIRSGFDSLNQSPKVLRDDRAVPSEGLSSVAGGIVALGKFDALHIGHRELAIQASKYGSPFLLSFVGIAEVLGWQPRAPIVAKCDRKRVLSSWAPYCGNMAPAEFQVEFSSVRHLTPREFVEKLSKDLRVRGVVAGENYRFGYKTAGDASELVRLCEEYDMRAYIINSVMDKNQYSLNMNSCDLKDRGQVSSTRVRCALDVGDMKYVSELLGRQHRLILKAKGQEVFTFSKNKVSASKSSLLNLAPKEGLYEKCAVFVGDEKIIPCRVVIDTAYIHIEVDDIDSCSSFGSQTFKLLRIEFG